MPASWTLTYNPDKTVTSDPPTPQFSRQSPTTVTFINNSGASARMGIYSSGHPNPADNYVTMVGCEPPREWIELCKADTYDPVDHGQSFSVEFTVVASQAATYRYIFFVVDETGGPHNRLTKIDPHVIIT